MKWSGEGRRVHTKQSRAPKYLMVIKKRTWRGGEGERDRKKIERDRKEREEIKARERKILAPCSVPLRAHEKSKNL